MINGKCSSVWSLMSYMAYSKGIGPQEIWSEFILCQLFRMKLLWQASAHKGKTFDNLGNIFKSPMRNHHLWNVHLAIARLHVECFAKIWAHFTLLCGWHYLLRSRQAMLKLSSPLTTHVVGPTSHNTSCDIHCWWVKQTAMIRKWDIVDVEMGVTYITSSKTPFLTLQAHKLWLCCCPLCQIVGRHDP
jgi:hypothetical protein